MTIQISASAIKSAYNCRSDPKVSNEISSSQKLSPGLVLFNGPYVVYARTQTNVVSGWQRPSIDA